jgi:hypothetical protein
MTWAWYVGQLVATIWIASGIGMLVWSILGRQIVLAFYPRGKDDPRSIYGVITQRKSTVQMEANFTLNSMDQSASLSSF